MHSTLGYESIARKKKVAIFSPKKITITYSSKEENLNIGLVGLPLIKKNMIFLL